jgi:methyl-accepting chemotaxis protein
VRILIAPGIALIEKLTSSQRYLLMAVLFTLLLVGAARLLPDQPGPTWHDPIVAVIVIGYLLASYQQLGQYLVIKTSFRDLRELVSRLSAGDLEYRGELANRGEIGALLAKLKEMSASLAVILEQVRQGAETIDRAAKEVAAGHVDLSRRTELQTATLEETAAGMEELAATVRQNAEHCQSASGLSQGASEVATRGAHTVHRVVERMGLIDASAQKIGDIIGVIEGIAFQTNILALNAAVEAARAGEQGQGFAVVAAEVRSLAQRCAAAAAEVKRLIEESAASVTEGNTLVVEAGQIIDEIVASVRPVSELIREIAMASHEQRTGVEAIKRALARLESVTQQNAALVQQTTVATLAFERETSRLTSATSRFQFAGRRRTT